MALLVEQNLLVAGDALAEIVGMLINGIERSDHYRVDTGQSGAHGFGLAAEQVHIGIEHRHVEPRGLGVDGHLASAVALGFVLLHNLCPKLAGGTEFGNLHEVDGRNAHVELDAAGHLVGSESGVGHHGHPLVAPCQGVAQFLIDICAGVVQHHAVNTEHLQPLHGLGHIHQLGCRGSDVAGEGHTVLKHPLERVEADGATERFFGSGLGDEFHQCLGHIDGALGAARDVDFHLAQVDALQQDAHIGGFAFFELEAQRGHALGEQGACLLVGAGLVVDKDVLAHTPVVAAGLVATHKWKFSRKRLRSLEVLDVDSAVKRLDIKPLVGTPNHFFVEVGTFEVHFGLCTPLLGGDRCKLVEQSLFVFCHTFRI